MERKLNSREIFIVIIIAFMICSSVVSMITMISVCDLKSSFNKSIKDLYEISTDTSITLEFEINGRMQKVNDYSELENAFLSTVQETRYEDIKIFDIDDVNETVMDMYYDKYIIERTVGIVTNEKEYGDGKILNTSSSSNYISYRNAKLNITDGTIILTYFVYSPGGCDPVERYDFILDREFED